MRVTVVLLLLLAFSSIPVLADVEVQVQRDGFLYVRHTLNVTADAPIALDLLGEPEELVVLEGGRPAYYILEGTELLVYPTMNTSLSVSYFTSTPSYKAGPLWFLLLNATEATEVELPEGAILVGINDIPEEMISRDGRLVMRLGPGEWNVTYILSVNGKGEGQTLDPFVGLIIISVAAFFAATILLKKRARPAVEALREDDRRILEFLRSKGGVAYASEIQRALGLPKTSAWRAIRRLERAGLVTIEKDAVGRNVVKLRS